MPGPGARWSYAPAPATGPTVGLLASAEIVTPVVDAAGGDPRGDRWLNGVETDPSVVCGNTSGTLPVGCGAPSTKTISDGPASTAVDPVLLWAGDRCSTLGWNARNFEARARGALAACEAWRAEFELWTGTAAQQGIAAGVDYPDDQWFAQQITSDNLTPVAPVTPGHAAILVQEASSAVSGDPCLCGSPLMWHVPRPVLPELVSKSYVRRQAQRFFDAADNLVVPGAGYPGTGPDGSQPAAGTVWTYLTSPVRIFREDAATLVPGTFAEAIDRAANVVSFRAERLYAMQWDRCCHFAIAVKLTDVLS